MRKLHPASVAVRSLSRSLNLGFLFFLVGVFASPGGAGSSLGSVIGMVLAGVVLAVIYEVAYYERFRYELTADTFEVTSGVLSRRNRELPLRRVQNVDVRQNVVQRALGIAALHVESAGGGQTEITLRFIAEPEATRLQRTLRRGTPASGAGEPTTASDSAAIDRPDSGQESSTDRSSDRTGSRPGADEEPETEHLFEMDRRELAILSVFTIDPGASLLATIALSFASGLDPTALVPVEALEADLPGTGLLVLGWIVLLFLLVAWFLSALLTFNRYYGFRLTRVGDELYYERGLLQRYSGSIPLEKVQTVTITESVPYRWFGYAALAVETAGYAPGQAGSRGSESAVPLASRKRAVELARDVEPFEPEPLRPIPKRARERYVVRYGLLVGVVTAIGAVVATYTAFDRWYLLAGFLLAVPVAAHLKWRSRAYRATEGYFLAQTGFWRRTTKVVPYYRIQTVVETATIFQRRRHLATVTADTASSASLLGRTAAAIDADARRARALRERLESELYDQLRERSGSEDSDDSSAGKPVSGDSMAGKRISGGSTAGGPFAGEQHSESRHGGSGNERRGTGNSNKTGTGDGEPPRERSRNDETQSEESVPSESRSEIVDDSEPTDRVDHGESTSEREDASQDGSPGEDDDLDDS